MTKTLKWLLCLLAVFVVILCVELVLISRMEHTPTPTQTQQTTQGTSLETDKPDTWEEYLALSLEERDAFIQQFASYAEFEAWLDAVKPPETTIPEIVWDPTGKLPNAYTWEEYQALTPLEQDAFFLWFGSQEEFEDWLDSVKPPETTQSQPGWDKPGKLPNAYTWEEYQALTPEEQDAFFLWFGSTEKFEAWMRSVRPPETTAPVPVWNKPGKLPSEYTWEEYQALTPQEQDAFFLWFGSMEAFEAWMDQAMNP
jgi:hypothetical protein